MRPTMYTMKGFSHKQHLPLYLFTLTLFLMGILFGAVIVNSLPLSQKEDLFYYVQQFFNQVSDGKQASTIDILKQSFLHNAWYMLSFWVLGMMILGLPFIYGLLFLKGVVMGFTTGFLVNQMGIKGFWLTLAMVLPQNLLNVPVFLFMAVLASWMSLLLLRKVFREKDHHFAIFQPFLIYIGAFFCSLGILLMSSFVEAYISPSLMEWTLKLI
jgi:stage II sporulation protein M